MPTYLITGCSRGIGLELVKQLTTAPSQPPTTVFATARTQSPALQQAIATAAGRAHFVPLDVTSTASITAAVLQISQHLGPDRGLDVLINNAGIQILEPEGATGMHGLEETLATNVVAVQKVSAALLPFLEKGEGRKIVNVSSELGSIGLKDQFPFPQLASYKISKTALNMLTVQWAAELAPRGFVVFCVSPGNLRTELGGWDAHLPVETGAKAVLDIVRDSTSEDNGVFRNIYIPGHEIYDGRNPPW